MTNPVAEIVTFTLAPGVSDADYLALNQKTEAFCKAQSGFHARQLSRDTEGRWTDYVLWSDMHTAKTAAANFGEQEFAPEMMAAIAPDSVTMRYEEVLWQL